MLLNEFLKEHRKVEKLEATLAALNARLKEQDAKIQEVCEQIKTQIGRHTWSQPIKSQVVATALYRRPVGAMS